MGAEQTITVAEGSEGDAAGQPVELPVVELLTGRAFLTGKSGSGKSNTASVVVERLLDRGFGVLIVDIEGEYYGLKEEYEILHAGADEECDIRVSEEHAGKLASLALEQNVPIILDLSGFIDEGDARELLKAVARQLFAKAKKVKQPFLLVVEEIHEYVPEGGGMDECGRMLVKVAKRGRKHGLGVAGISQRPADVKKDFITQCDWLVWHRLTWRNDTKVVRSVLGSEYADAIEDMDDGEGFLMTDWGEQVRRVQFDRKETFDAGATPGLEDFERPDLKSVSDDLVAELQTISEEQAAREDEIARLENELEEREQRIDELKEALSEARDLSDMAEQFARAMTQHGDRRAGPAPLRDVDRDRTARDDAEDPVGKSEEPAAEADAPAGNEPSEDDRSADDPGRDGPKDRLPPAQRAIVEDAAAANEDGVSDVTIPPGIRDGRDEEDSEGPLAGPAEDGTAADFVRQAGSDAPEDETPSPRTDAQDGREVVGEAVSTDGAGGPVTPTSPVRDAAEDRRAAGDPDPADEATDDRIDDGDAGTAVGDPDDAVRDRPAGASGDGLVEVDDGSTSEADLPEITFGEPPETQEPPVEAGEGTVVDSDHVEDAGDPASDAPTAAESRPPEPDTRPETIAADLRERVAELPGDARLMLAAYRDTGVATPEAVHEAVVGSGERAAAYVHNRALRREGFVVHVGNGRYAYSLPSLVAARTDADLEDDKRRQLVGEAEAPLAW